jgi:DNA recombination protein RmuC
MDQVLAITAILTLFTGINGLLVWMLVRRQRPKQDDAGLAYLQRELQNLQQTMDSKLGQTQQQMQQSVETQFRESQKLIQSINEQVNKQMQEVSKGVAQVGESSKQVFTIAEQLEDLEKTLKHQKQRGNLGEASLELILSNILPASSYTMQHRFQDGETVDAIIETKEGIIPIDAKFSLENYHRLVNAHTHEEKERVQKEFRNDLKGRIDETAKYIRPNEGTLPFAFMFIPTEAIYYELLAGEGVGTGVNARSLIDYAYADKGVIIVSPTTFAAYLQSVLYGFRAFQIEESAKQIGKRVEELSRHLKQYEEYYQKLGKSLETTVNHYNAGYKELNKIDKDVYRITGESTGVDPTQLARPERERE